MSSFSPIMRKRFPKMDSNAGLQLGVDMNTGKPIISYKAFDANMKCRDFQFVVGETYTHIGKIKACDSGFHACENPLDVLSYYNLCDSRFAVVEQSGEIDRHAEDSKIASAVITIKAELRLPEFIKSAIDWMLRATQQDKSNTASGYGSQLAASGDGSHLAASGNGSKLAASGYGSQLAASGNDSKLAASGDDSKLAASGYGSQLAASGYGSQLAASGDGSKLAASGYRSKLAASGNDSKLAASGDGSKLAASGDGSIAIAAAIECKARAAAGGCIALTRWDGKRYRVSVGYVGEGLKADTWYELDSSGKFVESK